MLIAMNAGNSHILLGGYQNESQQFTASVATEPHQTGQYYACILQQLFMLYAVERKQIHGAILSSVVPAMAPILTDALHLLGIKDVLSVSSGVKTGVNIRSEFPQQVGSDRVACAAAARAKGKLPCVVAALGTAATFTVLDQEGALVGSAITAGIQLGLQALREQAAQLPAVAVSSKKEKILARNTVDAIRVGAVYGGAALIEGMTARFAEALRETPYLITTGNDALLVEPYLHIPHEYDARLLLNGLALIWKRNRP